MLNIISIDIETDSSNGFGNIEKADREITAISLARRSDGHTITFGYVDYKKGTEEHLYVRCENEKDLLTKFLICWNNKRWSPDIVTGWNCIPVDQHVWENNEINSIKDVKEELYQSKKVNSSPISKKKKFEVILSNGQRLYMSEDHILPVLECDSEKYTKLDNGRKCLSKKVEMKLKDLTMEENTYFVEIPLRENDNLEQDYTDEELYLAGLIYTDGTLKNKNNLSCGYSFFQSDLEFISCLDNFGVTTKIQEPRNGQYVRNIKRSILQKSHCLIYNELNKKDINVNLLSKLSKRQFMLFFAGLLDGDGCFSNGNITFCNYNNDVYKIQELCQWNGIFSTVSCNGTSLRICDFDLNVKDIPCLKLKRWNNFDNYKSTLKRDSSQKARQIKYKKIGSSYYVKINNVNDTNEYVDMMDIETNTHLFVSNGVRVHNCAGFDIPIIVKRCMQVLGEDEFLKMSPFRIVREKEFNSKNNGFRIKTFELMGISIIDYMEAYLKFAPSKRESYSLGFISQFELGTTKVDYSQYGSLNGLYQNNPELFMDYNIKDSTLINQLEDKLHYIEQIVTMAYVVKCNYENMLFTVKPWDVLVINYLMDRNIVVPFFEESEDKTTIVGGFVKEPIPGLYEYIVTLDYTSLYPSVAMSFNISPDTIVSQIKGRIEVDDIINGDISNFTEQLKQKNYTMTANGCIFKRDQRGFIPDIMKFFFEERKQVKDRMKAAKKELQEIENELKKRGIEYK